MVYLPEELWSESTNHIDFYLSTINSGPAIPTGVVFHVDMYFSEDATFEEAADAVKPVLMPGNYPYDHRDAINSRTTVNSSLLRGTSDVKKILLVFMFRYVICLLHSLRTKSQRKNPCLQKWYLVHSKLISLSDVRIDFFALFVCSYVMRVGIERFTAMVFIYFSKILGKLLIVGVFAFS